MPTAPVLYVEDDPNDVFFMQRAFHKTSALPPLQVVTHGQQALDYVEGRGIFTDRDRYPLPCLILLDLNLPQISGFEVLRRLRAHPVWRDLPVAIVSSSDLQQDIEKAKQLGANEYLIKPRDPSQFTELLAVLKRRWL